MASRRQFKFLYIFISLTASYQLTIGLLIECDWNPFVCYIESHVTDFSNTTALIVKPLQFPGKSHHNMRYKTVDDWTKFSNVKDVRILNVTETVVSSNNFLLFQHMENINMSRGSIYTLTNVFHDGNTYKSIDLSFNKISFVGDNTFSNCKLLKTIYLNNNLLTLIQDETFADIPVIEEIFLNSNLIDTIQVRAFDIPHLERLHLQNNHLVELTDGLFSNAPKYLDLSSNQLKSIGGAFDDAIKLTNLIMNNNTQLHKVNLNALSELYNLNEISLNGTGFYFRERLLTHVYYGTMKRRHSNVKYLNLQNSVMVFDNHGDIGKLLSVLSTVFPFLETLHMNLNMTAPYLAYYFPRIKVDTWNNYNQSYNQNNYNQTFTTDFVTNNYYNSSRIDNVNVSNYTIQIN